MGAEKAYSFAVDELESGDPVRIKRIVERLKTLSLALGVDKFKDLLKKIQTKVEEEAFTDEVAAKLASVLGESTDFIGGPSPANAVSLLDILKTLAKFDETAVRDAAVKAIKAVVVKMQPADWFTCIAPVLHDLGKDLPDAAALVEGLSDFVPAGADAKESGFSEWAPAVSLFGLMATAYAALTKKGAPSSSSLHRWRLVTAFCRIAAKGNNPQGNNPLVKEAAAEALGGFLDAMAEGAPDAEKEKLFDYLQKTDVHGADILETWNEELLKCGHDYVKLAAVRASEVVFKYAPLASPDFGTQFCELRLDKSWKVRVEVAAVLAKVAENQKMAASKSVAFGKGNWQSRVKEICETLMTDPEIEVQRAFSLQGAAIAKALAGEDLAAARVSIFHHVLQMVVNEETSQRDDHARVLLDLAEVLQKPNLKTYPDPDVAKLFLEDKHDPWESCIFVELCTWPMGASQLDMAMRLAVLGKLIDNEEKPEKQSFLGVVGLVGAHRDTILNELRMLAGHPHWRTRHAVLLSLPTVYRVLKRDDPQGSQSVFNEKFGVVLYGDDDKEWKKQLMDKYQQSYQTYRDPEHSRWANDDIAQIRLDYVKVCRQLADIIGAPDSQSWVTTKILPVLSGCADDKKNKDAYHKRILLLQGLVQIGDILKTDALEEKVEVVLKMATEVKDNGQYVPSFRLMIARDLVHVAKSVSNKFREEHLIPTLNTLMADLDEDVRTSAATSLKALNA